MRRGGNGVRFRAFLRLALTCPPFGMAVLLTAGMVLVNGGTDAPNAIAGCVASRAIRVKPASALAAACNLLGALTASLHPAVADTVAGLADFGTGREAVLALCAGMTAVVVWSAAAWLLGLPTSESHALIAGLSGASMAVHHGFGGLCWMPWRRTLIGLLLSTLPAFLAGMAANRLIVRFNRKKDRRRQAALFRRVQIMGGAAMAFAHGAQDGQKFTGVLLLSASLAQQTDLGAPPPWLTAAVAFLMAAGTSLGGQKIIRTVGVRMSRPEPYVSAAADLSAAALLTGAALVGIPASTTHGKTAALMGSAAARRMRAVNWRVAGEMAWAWVLTFPGCAAAGYIAARIFLKMG